jgi:L-ribulose-5-phosphate 3-epimerase/hexulose-6-phosphate isomerase
MSLRDNPIGIYEKAIPNAFDFEDKFKIAKAAGFNFLEISIDESDERLSRLEWTKEERNHINALIKTYNMPINSMCLSGHRRFPFGSKQSTKRKKAYEIMDKAIQLAKDLNIQNIQLAGYDVYYEDSDDETLLAFKAGLRYAALKAEKADVLLSIEIMDTYLMGTITRALEFVHEINSSHLQIYPDIGNLTQWTDDPSAELKLGKDYIVAVHLKDTLPGVFKKVPFGSGTVDFFEAFKTLNEIQFKGPFLIEMWAENDGTETFDSTVKTLIDNKLWLKKRMC